ncbi:MAG TPA: isopentenyl-diphosphate Delta-isomerase [Bacteroidales bacterium]|nr:isopentenyl-diphosphate Delta-isomerase [Bacteroidales bacterium]
MQEPYVILVDKNDVQTGTAKKLEAHEQALLHRAVSVFIVNNKGEWILQRRALDKYHSRGLWTNTCCTHPSPGEIAIDAAARRLNEEMGMKCNLRYLFSFIYMGKLDTELTEHELDHVFLGITDDVPVINREEVEDWKYVFFEEMKRDIDVNPGDYTYWFRIIYNDVNDHIKKLINQF